MEVAPRYTLPTLLAVSTWFTLLTLFTLFTLLSWSDRNLSKILHRRIFRPKKITPLISLYFNSFGDKNTKRYE